MIVYSITESSIKLVQKHLQDNIATALANLRSERNDPKVSSEPPKKDSYFIYERAVGYQPPAVFTIADDVDFQNSAGPNTVLAVVKARVSVVVEDILQDNLTVKAWRYQDALYALLNKTVLVSANEGVKIVVVVQGATFSPVFTQDTDVKSARNTFRKEVVLNCDLNHFESDIKI